MTTFSTFGYSEQGKFIPRDRQESTTIETEEKETTNSLQKVCNTIFSSVVLTTGLICPAVMPVVLLLQASAADQINHLANYQKTCRNAGIIYQSKEEAEKYQIAPGSCKMLPAQHSAETEQWRLSLIASAEHNVVISGNYCGGKAFHRLLDAIEKRFEEKPHLKVVLISSPKFLNDEERMHVNKLIEKCGRNFSLVETPDIWHVSDGVKKTTNHTKVLAIDYGRYFIQGGSGIKSNFVEPGLNELSRVEYLNGEGIEVSEETPEKTGGFLGRLIPGSFRDQDFVAKSEIGISTVGTEVYRQALLLAYRWEEYNKQTQGLEATQVSVEELGLFTGVTTKSGDTDSVTMQLLKEAPPENLEIALNQKFEKDPRVATSELQVLAQGPMHTKSIYADHLIKHIKEAKKEIHINHMYFHPSQEIFEALVEAAKRGVKITIISNGLHKDAPNSHKGFVLRNRYNYNELINNLPLELRDNVVVYEFEQTKIGNHKKVIVIDDVVIAGSSNLGLKSTKWVCDDELNFVAKSDKLAKETLEIFAVDIQHSRRVTDFDSNVFTMTGAFFQRLMAPLID